MIDNNDGPMNARLIAAAPELLKWLKEILADVDAGNGETPETSRWQEAHAVCKSQGIFLKNFSQDCLKRTAGHAEV